MWTISVTREFIGRSARGTRGWMEATRGLESRRGRRLITIGLIPHLRKSCQPNFASTMNHSETCLGKQIRSRYQRQIGRINKHLPNHNLVIRPSLACEIWYSISQSIPGMFNMTGWETKSVWFRPRKSPTISVGTLCVQEVADYKKRTRRGNAVPSTLNKRVS